MLSDTSLAYLRNDVSLAAMPGSESSVPGGSFVIGATSADAIYASGTLLLKNGFTAEAERLACLEQVFVAALDTGRLEKAASLLADLEKRFPSKVDKDSIVFGSLRVAKLQGMLKEAHGEWEKALALYDKALAQDETYAPIIKRKVAVLVDQGKSNEAITTLVNYLDHFHTDLEAWTTLSNLYLRANMFQQSAFALEECMILAGFNFLYHIRYAEVQMTLGKYAVALKYFSSSVEVTESGGGSLRAWYGIRHATHALLDAGGEKEVASPTKSSSKKGGAATTVSHGDDEGEGVDVSPETLKALNKLAGERIEAIYKEKKASPENIEVVKQWIKTVG